MRLRINLDISKKILLTFIAVLFFLTAGLILAFQLLPHNPLPDNINKQVRYKVIYPSQTGQIDPNSYKYQTEQKTLSYKINRNGGEIVFTEQPAPEALGTGSQPYYPAISIHPYAQFNTNLGPVALTKFYQPGSFKQVGQAAVLASGGTLLIANSQKNLTNEQWKELFDSLKITR